MELRTIGDALIYLGMVATALTAIALVLRFAVFRPLMRYLKEQLMPKVDKTYSEVTPNSGHSMKDDLTYVKAALENHMKDPNAHAINH